MNRLTTLILLFVSISSFSQQKYSSPLFLIPYNDNGKWGWCDTLGEKVIDGDYKMAYFFYERYSFKDEFEASVTTSSGANIYNSKSGLLVPVEYSILKELYQDTAAKNRWIVIQNSSEKIGLYDALNKKTMVEPKWDKYHYRDEWKTEIYFSGPKEKTFWGYNFKTQKLYKTQIDSIFEMGIEESIDGRAFAFNISVFHHTNGKYTKFKDGIQVELNTDELKHVSEKWEMSYAATRDSDNPFMNGFEKATTGITHQSTGIIREIDYSNYSSAPFKKLIIQSQNGKVGVISDAGDTILPFEYDEISTPNGNTELMLRKGAKTGLKLLFTTYPIIEPKYQLIHRDRSLRVSRSWSFQIYSVELNGKTGYIGENGVEYFHFD